MKKIARREYRSAGPIERGREPIALFRKWYRLAEEAGVCEPNAMVLATVGKKGKPSARVVLLKGVEDGDFVFFTNYQSRKGKELLQNSNVALVFYWDTIERQVRVTGRAKRLSRNATEKYFKTRPRGAQIAAWASNQSASLVSREILKKRYKQIEEKYFGATVPCPPFWGGFRVICDEIEFWKGAEDRLHYRVLFQRNQRGGWKRSELYP